MSRLDQLIDTVRTRFLLQKLFNYGAWTVCAAAAVLVLVTIINRMFLLPVPPKFLLMGGAAILAVMVALVMAVALCPSREATAVRIDDVLKLKERFSTALLSRGSSDAFARAAVNDAESTASSVSVHKRFPFFFPRPGYYAMGAILALVIADVYMPQLDLFGKQEEQRQAVAIERKRTAAEKALRDALAEVMAIPKVGPQEKGLIAARKEIEALLNEEIKDPTQAIKTAQNALKEAEAARQKIEDVQRYANSEVQKGTFKPLADQQASGRLADVQKALGEGKFEEATTKLKAAVNEFATADSAKQEKMASDMKNLAEQMRKLAEDQNIQQRIQKELEKQGATPEQARQMADEMAKAAAGDQNAQQRVRDMAENLARKANGGVLPAPQQLAPFMQQMNQMQGQAAMQQQAAELAQAAQQLANAMAQQAQANQQSQPGKQQGQQANQQQGQQGQQGGNQPQNAQGQQGGQQPGQNQSGEAMADAQQAMEAALAELEAMRQAADAAQASRGSGEGEGGGDEGDGWGDQGGQGGQGQGQQGFGQGPSGPNMGGQGAGERPRGVPAPFTTKKEVSPGQTDDKGKTIASWLVKADSVKGESKEQFKEIVMSAQRDQAEDVDQDRIPMRAQKAVRDYFNALEQEAQ